MARTYFYKQPLDFLMVNNDLLVVQDSISNEY